MVMGDPEKLMRVFLNLCKNAVEAMPAGGRLTVACDAREKEVRIEIHDTGRGIPTGMNLFEPFTTSKPNGWGLGLSIVRQIVLAHGGTIEYVSEAGKGTTFMICLSRTTTVQ
jgi:signal transduction histidine kinase